MKNIALITGASGGIGAALATEHAKRGGDLILVARSANKLQERQASLKKQYQVKVKVIALDLSKTEAAQELYEQVQAANLQVNFLINNAGFGDYGLFQETDWQKEAQMIDLNMKSLTHLTKLFLPDMVRRKKGYIMNVASTAAFQPGPLMAVYFATKHYVLAFSEAIANEVKESGVRVTALCPGPTASGFQEAASMENSRLVSNKKLPASAEVAAYGYRAMLKGKPVAIHGTMNGLMARGVGFLPRQMVVNMVRRLQERA
ncbi:MAG: SDR family NAD(P)-dependent oxidoreductase [Cyclobacteriaceae bacterium]